MSQHFRIWNFAMILSNHMQPTGGCIVNLFDVWRSHYAKLYLVLLPILIMFIRSFITVDGDAKLLGIASQEKWFVWVDVDGNAVSAEEHMLNNRPKRMFTLRTGDKWDRLGYWFHATQWKGLIILQKSLVPAQFTVR